MQYEANGPCEDTYVCQQLHSIDAYTVSVFDGHGGHELADYCRSKINPLLDSFIKGQMKQLQESKQSVGKLFKDALKWSYQQI